MVNKLTKSVAAQWDVTHLIAVCLLACSAPSMAQIVPQGVAPPEPIVPQVYTPEGVSVGETADPLRVYGDDAPFLGGLAVFSGIGLDISAGLDTEYNDNVARVSDNREMSGRYKSKDDFIFRPNVRVSGTRPIGRQQLFVTGMISRDVYTQNTRLNKNRFQVAGGTNWALGTRCGGQLQAGYSTRATQFGAFEEVIPSTQEQVNFTASAQCRTATGLSGNISYSHSRTANHTDDPLGVYDRSYADVRSNSVSGGLGYPIGIRGEVGVQGNWRTQTFPNQLLPTLEANGSEIYGTNLFANYRLGTSLRVTGGIGKSWIKPKFFLMDDFSGSTWNLGLTYSGPRLGASVSTGKSVNGSSGGMSNYTIGKFFNASVSYRANQKMRLSAGYARSNTDYLGNNFYPEIDDIHATKHDRFFVGADYRLNRLLSLSADLNHQKRSVKPSLHDYKVNSASIGIRAHF